MENSNTEKLKQEFNSLVRAKHNTMLNFAKKFNKSEYSDIVQDAQIKVFKAIERGGVYEVTISLFYKAIRNVAMDYYRKNTNTTKKVENFCPQELECMLEGEISEGGQAPLPSDLNFLLEKVLGQDNAFVYNLFLEGYKQVEVAQLLDKPLGTMKSLKHECNKKLKKHSKLFESYRV